jgi:hypothetical protein
MRNIEEPDMKTRPANLFWMAVLLLVVAGLIYAAIPSRPDHRGEKIVEETRRLLRGQGFKTDLADFDFSTSQELRARETILKATVPTNRSSEPFVNHPNLMEITGTNSAIVVWKENGLKKQNRSWPDDPGTLAWDELRNAVNNAQIDAACAAVLSGPIAFNLNAGAGNAMLLPHLAMLKNLTQTLGSRTVLALHDGDKNAAFTNLLAETRLVTAWNPEPSEISHLVRFAETKLAFNATWQVLQTNDWPDEQLARLQAEWEAVNFFTNLPETAAFKRASDVAACEQNWHELPELQPTFGEFFHQALSDPFSIWPDLLHRWNQGDYFRRGVFEDETSLLLFYRDREIELRNAVQAPTWMQMRGLQGVANEVFFQSKNLHSRFQVIMNLHRMNMAVQTRGFSLLGRGAEAETERRILVTAIALERHRGKHGSYPQTLAALAPEFLKIVPADFMDGQPLRYRVTNDGHFILYSVGLDCVDDGGKINLRTGDEDFARPIRPGTPPPESDIVWPLPASAAEVSALRQKEKRAEELRNLSEEERESEQEWEQSPLRQSRVEKILATDWSPGTNMETYAGRSVVDILGNKNSGTNRLSLAELLTPRQIITGNEPEDLTFDVPIAYDVITNMGAVVLLADADTEEPAMPDSGAKMQDCERATNSDCLLIWHTIFDPPGKHAVQVQLALSTKSGGEFFLKGPAISVVTSNLCQFNLASAHFDQESGADFQARLPESNGAYIAEMKTTDGILLKTITGGTSNGVLKVHWDLIDEHDVRLTNDFFNSVFHITLPDSGRTQILQGP